MAIQHIEQGRNGGVSGAPLFDGPKGVVQAAYDLESWVPERFAGVDQLAPSASTGPAPAWGSFREALLKIAARGS